MEQEYIHIKGARVHNLKNIELKIPRNRFIVITGLSGSGKSSLAFDTLYAEGQRRYVESLSAYARQFLGRMNKPEVDFIRGIPPAIAIEQKVNTSNGRSTVGTSTEIYHYLRMLYARIGKTFSPISGHQVIEYRIEDVMREVNRYPADTRFIIYAPLVLDDSLIESSLREYLQQGFDRIEVEGRLVNIEEALLFPQALSDKKILLIIDRLSVSSDEDMQGRMFESIETAYACGNGYCEIHFFLDDQLKKETFSNHFELDGMQFQKPNDLLFNFNASVGACPECKGYGTTLGIDEDLVIPNPSLSVYEDCVICWRGDKMKVYKEHLIAHAEQWKFPIHTPYCELTESQKTFLWRGNGTTFPGIDGFFKMVDENKYKIQYRVMAARFKGRTLCPVCHGNRLVKEAEWIKVGGKSITELVNMPISQLHLFFQSLCLTAEKTLISKRLLTEIKKRLEILEDVGLGYLTLNRNSSSLSGGESQRINLVTSLGSTLVGSLYILDEPSIGLHSRDTERLINVLRKLQQAGNTVIVVEHDEEIIRAADYIVDIGPEAGRNGGKVVFAGTLDALPAQSESYTVRYLQGKETIPIPCPRRKWHSYVGVKNAMQHNLKRLDVKFPLGVFTVVTGVSGSGKSSLINDVLYRGLKNYYADTQEKTGKMGGIYGDLQLLSGVEYIDQNPIGKSSRSNPVTYIKAFDEIRNLFAGQYAPDGNKLSASAFSFNSEGGRCETCKGEGTITIAMQFMADITIVCEDCEGKRYKPQILDVTYRQKNIYDILEMTINQAIEFFEESIVCEQTKREQSAANGNKASLNENLLRRIINRLRPLKEVGLGYIKLGQSTSTLSGGENQRLKLAFYLSQETKEKTLFIFDEPTTGLHIHDIQVLLKSFYHLLEKGHSLIVIEHNLEVIKSADYIIDLGPEGGSKGGYLVCTGTPEEVAQCAQSYTGNYLKNILNQ